MIENKREELLSHPLCIKYLETKWYVVYELFDGLPVNDELHSLQEFLWDVLPYDHPSILYRFLGMSHG